MATGIRMIASRSVLGTLLLVAALAAPGCGGSPSINTGAGGAPPSHGGSMVALPNDRGHVELLVDSKNKQSWLVAYFVKPDGSGPIDPAPKDVSFTPTGGASIPLTAKSGRFESEPAAGFQAGRELNGELSVNLGGEAVKVPVVTR